MENKLDFELCKDILSFGIKPTERILHLGCGDKQTNFLHNIQNINPAIVYVGVDVDMYVDSDEVTSEQYVKSSSLFFKLFLI